jgi:glycosyltransferase involved in cell wall biosynthesis
MRVLILSSLYPPVVGGTELQAQGLARALDTLGVQVSILTRPVSGADPQDRDGDIRIYRRLSALAVGPLWGLTYMLSTQRWLRRLQREWDVVHNQQVALHSWPSVRLARALGRPCLLRFASLGRGGDLAVLSRHRFGHRMVSQLADAGRFIALTPAGAQEIRSYHLPEERVRCIPNGVDLERFKPQPWPLVSDQDPLRLLFVGRLAPEKGLDILLQALQGVNDRTRFGLRIVGAGPEETRLREFVAHSGLSATVEFCGSQRDPIPHYAWCELLVLPSHFEGMPNVVLEAMASARPVLGTQVDGTSNLIREGLDGWLVPSADPEALARRLERIANERSSLASVGCSGRQRAEASYSLARVATRYVSEYQAMLSTEGAMST